MQPMNPTDFLPAGESNRILAQNLAYEEHFENDLAEGFSTRIKQALNAMGVPPRLQKSTENPIPEDITKLKTYSTFPEKGFGIVGPGGCGKSCAFTWAIKQTLFREYIKAGPTRIEESTSERRSRNQPFQGTVVIVGEPKTKFRWVGWPAFACHMKAMASRREWLDSTASTAELIGWITQDPEHRVLILDDIGEEDIKPSSYTTEQLELLIDEAYNHEARVFWTSNHTPDHLQKQEVYGYRLVSRLTGLSPDIILPWTLPDLRVRDVK